MYCNVLNPFCGSLSLFISLFPPFFKTLFTTELKGVEISSMLLFFLYRFDSIARKIRSCLFICCCFFLVSTDLLTEFFLLYNFFSLERWMAISIYYHIFQLALISSAERLPLTSINNRIHRFEQSSLASSACSLLRLFICI